MLHEEGDGTAKEPPGRSLRKRADERPRGEKKPARSLASSPFADRKRQEAEGVSLVQASVGFQTPAVLQEHEDAKRHDAEEFVDNRWPHPHHLMPPHS